MINPCLVCTHLISSSLVGHFVGGVPAHKEMINPLSCLHAWNLFGFAQVISAMSNFMAASQSFANGTLSYGVMGAVKSIPAGYSLETVVSVTAAGGVNRAMEDWGGLLLAKHGKARWVISWRRAGT